MLPTLPPPSAPLPSPPAQTGCFPTSSRTAPATFLTSSLLTHSPISTEDLFQRHLGIRPTGETDTLSIPLALARIIWPSTCEKHNPRLHPQGNSGSHSHHHSHERQSHQNGSSSCCSHSHDQDDLGFPRAEFNKIGTAFEQCSHELRHFIRWNRDTCPWCVVVNEEVHEDVTLKLRDFGFFEDATGKHQECLSRKANSKSKCRSGLVKPLQLAKTTTSAGGTSIAKSAPAAAKMPSAAASTSHTKSSPATLGATPPKAVAATSASTPAIKAATDHVSQPAGTVSPASAKAPVANPASKKATTTPATTTTKKATSSREQQKKPEPTVSPSLLSDCRKFETFAESNAEKRTHMASNAKLTEIMRSLNRAVLVFCTSHRYNLIYAELASLVALLNYAAAFYYVYADNMEGYMGQYLEHGDLQHLFSAVYRNRADYIETEEYRTSGSSSDGQTGYSKERAARRHVILEEFNSMVPDVTDLRDGVQTILFTFTWINYTAFQGADKAVASTLHTLIPLLQTIIVRATRQAYHLRGALIAATTKSALSEKPPPKGTDLQWDLVELSNSLQNLSGSDVALYAPIVYSKDGKKKKKKGSKKKKKKAIGWPESVVSVPYIVSLYTAGVADIAYRFLNKAVSAQQSGILSEQPEKEEIKKCSPTCKCPTAEDKQKPIIDELDQRTTLVERKQRDWKPLVVKDQTSKGKKKKAKKKKQKEQREQEEEKGQQEQKKLKSPFLDCLKKMQGENSDDEYDCDICPEDGVGEILMDRFYDIATYNSRISAKAEIDKAVQRNKEVKAGAVAPTTATKNNGTPGKPAATPSKPDAVPSPKSAFPDDAATPDRPVAIPSESDSITELRSLITAALTESIAVQKLTDSNVAQHVNESLLLMIRELASLASASNSSTWSKPASSASATLPKFDFPYLDSDSPLTTPESRSASPTSDQHAPQPPGPESSRTSSSSPKAEAATEIPPMPPGFKEYFELLYGDRLRLGEMNPEWAHLARDPEAPTIKEAGLLESEEFLQRQWKNMMEVRRSISKSQESGSELEALGSGWGRFGLGRSSSSAEKNSHSAPPWRTSSPSEAATIMLTPAERRIPPVPSGFKDIFREMMGDVPMRPHLAHLASNPNAKTLRHSGVLDHEEILQMFWSMIYQRTRAGIAHKGKEGYGPFTPSEYVSLVTAAPPEASASTPTSTTTPCYRPIPSKFKEMVERLVGDEPLGTISTKFVPAELASKVPHPSTLNESGFLDIEDFYLERFWRTWNDLKRQRLEEQGGPPPDPAEGIDLDELKEEFSHVASMLWEATRVLNERYALKKGATVQEIEP